MKNTTYIIIAVSAILTFSGCAKMLDSISPKGAIRTDELTDKDLGLLTNGTMHMFEALVSNLWFDGDYLAEDFTGGPGYILVDIHAETQSASSSLAKSRWQYCFNYVNYANQLLLAAKSATNTTADVRYALGVAYFFRAMIYYNLVIRYGGVPVITEPAKLDIVPRSSEKDVYAFILSDLTEAEKNLDHFSSFANPSLEAVWTLAAKVNLWLGNKETAAAYAEKVLEGKYFTLSKTSEEFASMFIYGTSKEIIFAPINIRTTGQIRLFESVNDTDGSFLYSPDPKFFSGLYSDNYGTGDIRKPATFTVDDPSRVIKFPNGSLTCHQFIFNSGPSESPLLVFRLADVYLVLAEAYGNTDDGIKSLKTLMSSRYSSVSLPASMTDSEYENLLLDENLREFYSEGRRWFDVKRFCFLYHPQDFHTWIDTQYASWKGRDFLLYWPIPQEERDKAKGQYTQNPGYEQ